MLSYGDLLVDRPAVPFADGVGVSRTGSVRPLDLREVWR